MIQENGGICREKIHFDGCSDPFAFFPVADRLRSGSFAGDFYGYIIEYTDDAGYRYSHRICESGLDGSLVVNY